MSTPIMHLATVQVTAEPNGYAVWHTVGDNLSLHSFHKKSDPPQLAERKAMGAAAKLIRQYKPDFGEGQI